MDRIECYYITKNECILYFDVQYKIILKIREIDLKISTSVLHKDFLFTEMQNKMIIRSPS